MSQFYNHSYKVGILGGGQLGRMFIQKAIDFDISIHILDPDENAPCNNIAHNFEIGDIRDFDSVYAFGKDKDLLTIEIENVNVEALAQLEHEGVTVFPQPRVIKLVQDKGLQKEFYKKNGIPTAPFELIEADPNLEDLSKKIPFVQKLRKGGYDGRGVQVVKIQKDLSKCFKAPSVREDLIDFEKELSVIVARNKNGEIRSFPLVELEFNPEANLVEYLFAPATTSKEVDLKAKSIAEDLISKLDMVGILAVEMFLTKTGDILVNEIAPRPHNSGHHTIEANITSQYEQHLRSILNLPLGSTELKGPSVMVNILGEAAHEGLVVYKGMEEILSKKGIHPHLYGKTITKPFRKMGHVTIVDDSLEKAKETAKWVIKTLKATT